MSLSGILKKSFPRTDPESKIDLNNLLNRFTPILLLKVGSV